LKECRQIDILVGDFEFAPYFFPVVVDGGIGNAPHLGDFLGALAGFVMREKQY